MGGRLVIVSRNPKDALVSGFFFLKKLQEKRFPDGKPVVKPTKDGRFWTFRPNPIAENMERYYQSFNAVGSSNAAAAGYGYGDYYTWRKEMLEFLEELEEEERGFL